MDKDAVRKLMELLLHVQLFIRMLSLSSWRTKFKGDPQYPRNGHEGLFGARNRVDLDTR